jgi:hypothetical protein
MGKQTRCEICQPDAQKLSDYDVRQAWDKQFRMYLKADAVGQYHCLKCGHVWKRNSRRYLYFPITLRWIVPRKEHCTSWFDVSRHGWQVGHERFDYPIFGWTITLGALRIVFGKQQKRWR